MNKDNVIWEMCPHCDCEVELEWELKPQVCPSCGKWICPCSMCEQCTKYCVIEYECLKRNQQEV